MSILNRTALATALLAVAPLASAASSTSPQTDTMEVSITIENACTITAGDMNFGTVADVATARQASTTVSVSCSGAGPIEVGLNAGDGTGSTFADRQMDNGAAGDTIDFNLYTATGGGAGGGSIIGDGSTGTVLLYDGTATGGNSAQSFNVYGYVPAQGAVSAGTYNSSLTATVTF